MKKRLFCLCVAIGCLCACVLSIPAGATEKNDDDNDDNYEAAVEWAVRKGITTENSGTFDPSKNCSRQQILTFLWRYNGSPSLSAKQPFTDVTSDSYFDKAAIWSYFSGIETGKKISDVKLLLEGGKICTRAAAIEYLWIMAGRPAAELTEIRKFTDISFDQSAASQKTFLAVAWALDNGITNGTSDATFSPDVPCTRGQIAAFLLRYDAYLSALTS